MASHTGAAPVYVVLGFPESSRMTRK